MLDMRFCYEKTAILMRAYDLLRMFSLINCRLYLI